MALNYNLAKVYALSDNDPICKRNSNFVCYRVPEVTQIKEE
jgi:hypothetical protein